MPRPVPKYQWGFTSGEPLKGEQHSHRIPGKAKGKGYKTDKPAAAMPTQAQTVTDVHCGSHKAVERAIGAEMKRLGL